MNKSTKFIVVLIISIFLLGAIYGLFFYRRVGFGRLWRLGEINAWIYPDEWIVVDNEWYVSEVFVYNLNSKRYRRVDTPEIGYSPQANLSLDGGLLAYNDIDENLRIVNVSSGEVLYNFSNQQGWPIAFSPDNLKMVAWKQDRMYLIEIMEKTETLIYQMDRQLFDEGLRVGIAEWRPNSEEVIFILHNFSREDGFDHPDEVHLFDTLTFEDQIIPLFDEIRNLKWSPDGNYIVYSYGSFSSNFGIKVFDILQNCTVLNIETTMFSNALWSPDGSRILYESEDSIKILDFEEEFGVSYWDLTCIAE